MNIREIHTPYSCVLCRDRDATHAIDVTGGYAIACCLECLLQLTTSLSQYVVNLLNENLNAV